MASTLRLRDGQRFVFMGDSITDCGRLDQAAPYGYGYAAMTVGLVTAGAPELRVEWFNRGVSGHTTEDLEQRWQTDVLDVGPDWMSVLIGINDCARYLAGREETGPEPYAQRYERLLTRAVEATGCSLILLEPFYWTRPPGSDEGQRRLLETLDAYRLAAADLAQRFGAHWIPAHQIGQEILEHHDPSLLCPEPVHPNTTGHAVLARALCRALGAHS